ncbi:MAG: hypothetical protein JW780_06710 [Clostridiales bacterium]|nr:hypothetical protein [Clostridiales bacterium]
MENYRKKIQRKMVFLGLLVLTAVALGVYNVFFESDPGASDFASGVLPGFRSGLAIALGGFALIQMIGYRQAIGDEKKLKELYNKAHDERLSAIRAKAGMPLLLITSVLMMIAAMVAGPLNITVFYSLLAASLAQLLIGLCVKVYYLRKM